MGRLADWVLGPPPPPPPQDPGPSEDLERGAIEDALAVAIRARQLTFGLSDALALPPLARAHDLIVTIGSSFVPIEYQDGAPAAPSRFVRQPDPFRTRQEWLSQVLQELVIEAEAFLLLGELVEGYPAHALVLPAGEVQVEHDARRFLPVYSWRGRELVHGRDIWHLALNRRAGQLHGRSVIREALPYLAAIVAAEDFAALSFGSGGVPTTVLKVAAKMTQDEAKKLKASWAASRAESAGTGEPAILSGGIEALFPERDPMSMQLQEARSYGATVVARLMGIPAPLLLAETSGATITYQNVDAVVSLLAKMTIVPKYLGPIEGMLSALTPRTRTVRFSLAELNRADVATRFGVYAQAIDSGILTPDEVRQAEGLAVGDVRPATLEPSPHVATSSSIVPRSEVPTA